MAIKKALKQRLYAVFKAFLAGDERIELPPKVLETPIIPFDQSPVCASNKTIIHDDKGFVKRRWRDLNPRAGCPAYRISSADPSATWVHLRSPFKDCLLLYRLESHKSNFF